MTSSVADRAAALILISYDLFSLLIHSLQLRSDSFNTAYATTAPGYQTAALKQEKVDGASTLRVPNPQAFDHSLPSPTDSYRTNGSPFGSTSSLSGGKRGEAEVSKSEATPTLNDSTTLLCDFLRGSSVADTPVSSPSSDEESATSDKGGFVDIKPSLKNKIPEEVKLPQSERNSCIAMCMI